MKRVNEYFVGQTEISFKRIKAVSAARAKGQSPFLADLMFAKLELRTSKERDYPEPWKIFNLDEVCAIT